MKNKLGMIDIKKVVRITMITGMILFLLSSINCIAQSKVSKVAMTSTRNDTAYANVISKRVAKILDKIKINSVEKKAKLQKIVEGQYFDLNDIYTARDKKIKELKSNTASDKAQTNAAIDKIRSEADAQVAVLHPKYIAKLQNLLTKDQIAQVKDGMTYNVLEVTYHAYTEMLPNLTTEQKTQIMSWLKEAREHAIDGESSEKKHAWFGKYKGRINNYLAKAGIDMKQAENAWQARIKEEKQNKDKQPKS